MTHVFGCSLAVPRIKAASALVAPSLHHLSVSHQARKAKIVQFRSDFFIQSYGPRSVMASSPDSHAGGPGFKSWCRPTNFRPVWSPSIPIPRLKSKNGKGFPEEGEVRAEGLWFWRAPQEAKKRRHVEKTTRKEGTAKETDGNSVIVVHTAPRLLLKKILVLKVKSEALMYVQKLGKIV